jgi:hypothetical protein
MMVSTTAAKAVTTAGIALLVCFLISRLLLINSSFDTGQRGLALGAVSGSIGLTLLWFVIAVVLVRIRLGTMPRRLWAVLALDGLIVGVVVVDWVRYLLR